VSLAFEGPTPRGRSKDGGALVATVVGFRYVVFMTGPPEAVTARRNHEANFGDTFLLGG